MQGRRVKGMMAGNVDSLTHNPTVTWRLQNPCVHMVSDISSRKSLKSMPSGSHFNCGLINDWCWGLFLIHALNQVNPVALNRKLLSMKKNKYAGAIYIFTIPKMTLDVSSILKCLMRLVFLYLERNWGT